MGYDHQGGKEAPNGAASAAVDLTSECALGLANMKADFVPAKALTIRGSIPLDSLGVGMQESSAYSVDSELSAWSCEAYPSRPADDEFRAVSIKTRSPNKM